MSLEIARQIIGLIRLDKEDQVREILASYSPEERQCIVSTKYKCSSLLSVAIAKESVLLVTYFLESCGADPNSFGVMDGEKLCCLAVAIDVNSEIIVGILLAHGANTENVSSFERTPLFHACCDDLESIVRQLIEHGADVNSRNYAGETPLTESTDNTDLFKHLISKGANIDSVDDSGHTVLMVACEAGEDEIVQLLLNCENIDVRVINNYGEDALHLAIRYCSEGIVEKIIEKGSYTNDEVVRVYEHESCLFRVGEDVTKARELWEKVLKLRSEPSETPMFETQQPVGKLQKVADILNAGDVPALVYLESIGGLNNLFGLTAYVCAACNISNETDYLTLCEFFFEILTSLEDKSFLKSIGQCVVIMRHFLYAVHSRIKLNLLMVFRMFGEFVAEIRVRLERMTPRERTPHANDVECLLYFIIELVCNIEEKCPKEINLFHEGIKLILKKNLRGLRQKSLIQICGSLRSPDRIIKRLIICRADVNSPDKEGKTVLHGLVESSEIPCRLKMVKKIIKNGFDFSLVKCDEYCLPCKMEQENILPNGVKYISLQCLAARTLCETRINCFNNVPHYLRTVMKSHHFVT